MSDLIPCEFCHTLIRFDEYTLHTISCQFNRLFQQYYANDHEHDANDDEQNDDEHILLTYIPSGHVHQQIVLVHRNTLPFTDNYNQYENNLQLAELIGKVEVGVQNIDKVVQIVEKNYINNEDMCVICINHLNQINDEIVQTSCGHKFCKSCISTWLNKNTNCPICITDLQNSQATANNDEDSETDQTILTSNCILHPN